MSAGKIIAELRKRNGWTQARLARETGFSRGHIATIEQGRVSVSTTTMEIIAAALGVEIKDIKGDK